MIELSVIAFLYFTGMACFWMLLTTMKIKVPSLVAKIGLVIFCALWPIFVMLSLMFAPFKK